jgi:hypothetical protein
MLGMSLKEDCYEALYCLHPVTGQRNMADRKRDQPDKKQRICFAVSWAISGSAP